MYYQINNENSIYQDIESDEVSDAKEDESSDEEEN